MDQAHNVQWRAWYPGCHHGQEKSASRGYAVYFALLTHICIFLKKVASKKLLLILKMNFSFWELMTIFFKEKSNGLCLVQVSRW